MSHKMGFSFLLALLALLAGVANMRQAAAADTGSRYNGLTPQGAAALLPGDSEIATAAGNQQMPQIVPGGDGYLVVWEDSRTNLLNISGNALPSAGEQGGQSLKDIYAARLDANGRLLDSMPIVVSAASWDQAHPRAAWNGQNWLVVWESQRVAGFTYTTDVLAARVSPTGALLDSIPIVVDGSNNVDEFSPTVASDGTNWVVVWFDQGAYFELDGARISAEGANLDPGGVPLHTPNFPDAPSQPSIAFAADEYLLVWQTDDIRGLRLSRNLARIGSVFTVSAQIGNEAAPTIAANGSDFFVAWRDARSLQTLQVYGARIAHNGRVLDPDGLEISTGPSDYPVPRVVWDGTRWWVSWESGDDKIYAARVAANGAIEDIGGTRVVEGLARMPSLAPQPGGGVRLVWSSVSSVSATQIDVYGATIGADMEVSARAPLSLGAPAQWQPRLAASGSGYLAVFLSQVGAETRIKGQRLDTEGSPLDATPFLIAGGATLYRPAVTWNGALYLVVWEDYALGTVYGRRYGADGAALDAAPFSIMVGNSPAVAALGNTFLIVASHPLSNEILVIDAVRVSAAGAVLGAPVTIGQNFAFRPHVQALGDRWLAVWSRQPTHDNPHQEVRGSFVNADGTPEGEFVVAGDRAQSFKTPDLAAGPDQALVAYFKPDAEGGGVFARRIQSNGTMLDDALGFQLTSAANAQFLPALAWDGSEYVVAYEDYRWVAELDRPRSDVYASLVRVDGTVLDASGFAVANTSAPEIQPAVVALNGSYVIGFADFSAAAPYAAYRINIRHGTAGNAPAVDPTVTATPTLTSVPTASVTASATATATATTCASSFSDVPSDNVFYPYVHFLACAGIVSGYDDGTFRPYVGVTRSQLAKIIANAAGYAEAIALDQQTFVDVPPASPFWEPIERLYGHGVISGYSCGVGCLAFHPGDGATRSQVAKIAANAAGMNEAIALDQQTFVDVPPASPFWIYIERLYERGVISGYSCGTGCQVYHPSEPTIRGQLSKITSNTFYPGAVAP